MATQPRDPAGPRGAIDGGSGRGPGAKSPGNGRDGKKKDSAAIDALSMAEIDRQIAKKRGMSVEQDLADAAHMDVRDLPGYEGGKRGVRSYEPSKMPPNTDIPNYDEGDWAYGPVAMAGALMGPIGPMTPGMAALSVATENTLADQLGLDPGVHTGGTDVDRDTNPGRYGGQGMGSDDNEQPFSGEATRPRPVAEPNGDSSPALDMLYGEDQYSDVRMKDRRAPRDVAAEQLQMLSGDAAFQDKYLSGDSEAVQRMRRLQSMML